MRTNIYNKVRTLAKAVLPFYLFTLLPLFTACSDVDLPESASDGLDVITNLRAEYQDGRRDLTLRWTNPAGISGIQIIKDNTDVLNLDEVVDFYYYKKVPTNVELTYTLKARYPDGRVSAGTTTRALVSYQSQKGGNMIAMLVPDDYTESDDEADAVAWFKKNYVDAGTGVLVTPATIDDLDSEKQAACWVMCDRVGIDKGWQNLPGNLAASATIDALKTFAADGGNLFLTNHATQLTVAVGRLGDAYAPNIYGSGEPNQNNDVWGSQPVLGNVEGQVYDRSNHAVYWGMDFTAGFYARSIYCFEGAGQKGDHNCMWDLNGFGFSKNPNTVVNWEEATNSTVLGTWNHVEDYCCAGIVDFAPTTTFKGRVLAVGLASYEWNIGGENAYQGQLEKFTANCISYLK